MAKNILDNTDTPVDSSLTDTEAGSFYILGFKTGSLKKYFPTTLRNWLVGSIAGDGTEEDSNKLRVKLDGTTLSRDSDGLSVTNPFTDADESKLDGIATGAEVNPSDSDIGDKAFSNPPNDLTNTEKSNVRTRIGAGTSSFSGAYSDLTGSKPPETPSNQSTAKKYNLNVPASSGSPTWTEDTGGGGGGGNPRGAGDGLVLDGNDLDVNPGDGVEIDSDKVRVKLDGTTLSRSSSGLSVTNPFTDTDETKLDSFPSVPSNQSTVKKYNLNVPASSGSATWTEYTGSVFGFYDSEEQSNSTNVTVSDTDAIPMPTINENGVVETESITGFGTVYKTSALKQVTWSFNLDATQGVGIRLKYSDTKPTASSDAKNYGTEVIQVNDGTDGSASLFDQPANRYWWFALSGGGSRTISSREVRLRAGYETIVGSGANPDVSAGLTVSSSNQDLITDITAGDVYEILFVGSKSGIDGGQPFADSMELSWNEMANGAFRISPSFASRLAGSNNGILDGNEAVLFTKDATNNKIQVRYNATAWSGVTLKIYTYKVKQAGSGGDGGGGTEIAFHDQPITTRTANTYYGYYGDTSHWSASLGRPSGIYISDIATDSNNDVYATDGTNLYKYDSSANTWGSSLGRPTGTSGIKYLAINSDNDVYVRGNNESIYKYDTSTSTWGSAISPPAGTLDDIAVDSNDDIYASVLNELYKYDVSAGTWSASLGKPAGSSDDLILAVDSNDDVYAIVQYGDLYKYDVSAATWSASLGRPSDGSTSILCLAVDSNDDVYTVTRNDLYKYDSSANTWGPSLGRPMYTSSINNTLAVDSNDDVYAVSSPNLYKYSLDLSKPTSRGLVYWNGTKWFTP